MRTWRWYAVRLELAMAFVVPGIAALLLFAAPNTMGGTGGSPLDSWVTWIGVAGVLVGLLAMSRIHRADPQRGPSSWRAIRR